MADTSIKRSIERFSEWVVDHNKFVLLLSLMIVLISSAGMSRLYFTMDYSFFFGPDNPDFKAYEEMNLQFTSTEGLLIAVAPDDKNIFSQESVLFVDELTEALWQIPYSTRVDSMTNYQETIVDGDDIHSKRLFQSSDRKSVV